MVLRFNSSIWPMHTCCIVRPTVCGYGACTIHPCCAAKVTILAVTSVVTWMWWSCSMTSSHNLEVPSVCVPLSRSPLSWWHQQVTWMWCHCWLHQVSCWMSPSTGGHWANQLPSTTKDSALPDQLNDGIYVKQCGWCESFVWICPYLVIACKTDIVFFDD